MAGNVVGFGGSIDQNLILTGYLGPRQLPIARQTAEYLKIPFVDVEARIEALGGAPSNELRAQFGEAHVKVIEAELMGEIQLYRGTLLHVSAQTLLRGALDRLRPTGPIICTVATLDAVLCRLHIALGGRFHDPRQRDLAMGVLRREWAIRGRPGVLELDTSAMDDAQMIEAIASLWRQQVTSFEPIAVTAV
jgi:hypothetical protein